MLLISGRARAFRLPHRKTARPAAGARAGGHGRSTRASCTSSICARRWPPRSASVLERLLTYGPPPSQARPRRPGSAILIVPRAGTISPWSSKATDIAQVCGLSAVRRIERGIAYRLQCRAARWARERLLRLAPALFDRMTEMVLFDARARPQRLFEHAPPQPLARDLAGRGARRRWSAANRRAGSRAVGRRDRLPAREFHAPRPRSDRRRADDVRAGELRALPPQDLQRRLDHRRQPRSRSRCSR